MVIYGLYDGINDHLLGGWATPLKNDGRKSVGIYHIPNIHGKIKAMFQTTNSNLEPPNSNRLLAHAEGMLLIRKKHQSTELNHTPRAALLRRPSTHGFRTSFWHVVPSGWWFQPLWKIWKSVGMIVPYILENKKCLKPPTSHLWSHSIPIFLGARCR